MPSNSAVSEDQIFAVISQPQLSVASLESTVTASSTAAADDSISETLLSYTVPRKPAGLANESRNSRSSFTRQEQSSLSHDKTIAYSTILTSDKIYDSNIKRGFQESSFHETRQTLGINGTVFNDGRNNAEGTNGNEPMVIGKT